MFPLSDTVAIRRAPIVIWVLVAINVLAFLQELALGPALPRVLVVLGVVPARIMHPEWARAVGLPGADLWPFLTSMFLHGSLAHIVGNMWMLWIFGPGVEDRMGHGRFALFYVVGGVIAGVTHVVTNPSAVVPTIGASGAIAAVLGAYMRLFPHARVITMVPLFFWPFFFELPAVTYLLIWFLMQLWGGALTGLAPGQVGGIAWWAHIGGFVAGFLLVGLFRSRAERGERPLARDEAGFYGAWGPHA